MNPNSRGSWTKFGYVILDGIDKVANIDNIDIKIDENGIVKIDKNGIINMKKEIFIGWSGEKSKKVAEALRDWIPNVIQNVQPWVSFKDIGAGDRWFENISRKLENYHFGIFCITRDNNNSIWMHYEAGALSKVIENGNICPYLIDIKTDEIKGPLWHYQACDANKDGTFHLMKTINDGLESRGLSEKQFETVFDHWWLDLKSRLESIQKIENLENNVQLNEDKCPNIPEILDHDDDLKMDNYKEVKIYKDSLVEFGDYNARLFAVEKSTAIVKLYVEKHLMKCIKFASGKHKFENYCVESTGFVHSPIPHVTVRIGRIAKNW